MTRETAKKAVLDTLRSKDPAVWMPQNIVDPRQYSIHALMSVQPMSMPTGQVFYLDLIYTARRSWWQKLCDALCRVAKFSD